MTARRRSQEGSATLTVVLFTPVVLVLLAYAVFLGRSGSTRQDVVSAAQSAARAVAVTEDPSVAHGAAATTLAERGVSCAQRSVSVDDSQLRPDGMVRVTVSCVVAADGIAPGFEPPDQRITATAIAHLDAYRAGP